VLVERTSVGLDVHARSVVAAAIDGVTGAATKHEPPSDKIPDGGSPMPLTEQGSIRRHGKVSVRSQEGFGELTRITAPGVRTSRDPEGGDISVDGLTQRS
jgi:hypothetical protein